MKSVVFDLSRANIIRPIIIKSFNIPKIILPVLMYNPSYIKTIPIDSELHSQR